MNNIQFDTRKLKKLNITGKSIKLNLIDDTIIYNKKFKPLIKSKGGKPSFRCIDSLKRSDATYEILVKDKDIKISDINSYTLGYLRGLIDSDGCYEFRKDRKGKVQFIQKDKDLVNQFKDLYDKYIKSTKSKVFLDSGIYKFNGYRISFENKTYFQPNNISYLWGYLIGFFIGDGSLSYNISNRHLQWNIVQSCNKKFKYCENIKYILDTLKINYSTSKTIINNFNMQKDCIMLNFQGSGSTFLRWPVLYNCDKINKIYDLIYSHLSTKSSIFKYKTIKSIEFLDDYNCIEFKCDNPYLLENIVVSD